MPERIFQTPQKRFGVLPHHRLAVTLAGMTQDRSQPQLRLLRLSLSGRWTSTPSSRPFSDQSEPVFPPKKWCTLGDPDNKEAVIGLHQDVVVELRSIRSRRPTPSQRVFEDCHDQSRKRQMVGATGLSRRSAGSASLGFAQALRSRAGSRTRSPGLLVRRWRRETHKETHKARTRSPIVTCSESLRHGSICRQTSRGCDHGNRRYEFSLTPVRQSFGRKAFNV
jgi:hypothetical protein